MSSWLHDFLRLWRDYIVVGVWFVPGALCAAWLSERGAPPVVVWSPLFAIAIARVAYVRYLGSVVDSKARPPRPAVWTQNYDSIVVTNLGADPVLQSDIQIIFMHGELVLNSIVVDQPNGPPPPIVISAASTVAPALRVDVGYRNVATVSAPAGA